MTIPDHLITPGEWHAEAVYHAAENLGTPEGRRALAEAARYAAMSDMIRRLTAERDALRDANASLHAQVNDWHRRAVETREERDALAAKLAEIKRPVPLTDERIDAIADLVIKGMPDGIRGFCRVWGWQQFARELLTVCAGHYRPVPATPDGCGACGDACASRGACRLAEESPPANSIPAIPDGWKLVPVEPTPKMIQAVITDMDDFLLGSEAEDQYRADWAAMLAAAPETTR